jgi:hypothetical protein
MGYREWSESILFYHHRVIGLFVENKWGMKGRRVLPYAENVNMYPKPLKARFFWIPSKRFEHLQPYFQ